MSDDPFRSFNFKIEIQGVTEGHFVECTGFGVDVQPIPYREAGTSQLIHKLTGRLDYSDVTLSYGLTQSTELWDWLMQIVQGNVERKNVSVVLLQSNGSDEATRWNLESAWPRSWRGAPLDALGSEAAIESMTLTFESLQRG